jgi:hypothetical protein
LNLFLSKLIQRYLINSEENIEPQTDVSLDEDKMKVRLASIVKKIYQIETNKLQRSSNPLCKDEKFLSFNNFSELLEKDSGNYRDKY